MKRFRIHGVLDAVVFIIFLLVVRYSHQQIPIIRSVQNIFLVAGAMYYSTVYMIEVRKTRR